MNSYKGDETVSVGYGLTKAHKDRLVEKSALSNKAWMMGFSHRTSGIDPGKAYKSISKNLVGHNESDCLQIEQIKHWC